MKNFNLIVSSPRFREEDACSEILELLDLFGDPSAEAQITEVKGIVLVTTALDSLDVIERLRNLVADEPWKIRYIMRVIPIEKVVQATLGDIQSAVVEMAARIGYDESFRVTVEKRHNPLHSIEIIECIAEAVKNKVNLTRPDWIVLIEIVGRHAGISVIRDDRIFSSIAEKRESNSV